MINCSWKKEITFLNNSEHNAYNLKIISDLDKSHFKIERPIDNLKPLKSNEQVCYTLLIKDSYERRESQAHMGYRETKIFEDIVLILEYTNVKGTRFYTKYSYLADANHQNVLMKRYNHSKKNDQ